VKNENHDFITLGGLNPLKCFQSDGKSIGAKGMDLGMVCA